MSPIGGITLVGLFVDAIIVIGSITAAWLIWVVVWASNKDDELHTLKKRNDKESGDGT